MWGNRDIEIKIFERDQKFRSRLKISIEIKFFLIVGPSGFFLADCSECPSKTSPKTSAKTSHQTSPKTSPQTAPFQNANFVQNFALQNPFAKASPKVSQTFPEFRKGGGPSFFSDNREGCGCSLEDVVVFGSDSPNLVLSAPKSHNRNC